MICLALTQSICGMGQKQGLKSEQLLTKKHPCVDSNHDYLNQNQMCCHCTTGKYNRGRYKVRTCEQSFCRGHLYHSGNRPLN